MASAKTEAAAWAISVAQATPVTPIAQRITNAKSSPMFSAEENASK